MKTLNDSEMTEPGNGCDFNKSMLRKFEVQILEYLILGL